MKNSRWLTLSFASLFAMMFVKGDQADLRTRTPAPRTIQDTLGQKTKLDVGPTTHSEQKTVMPGIDRFSDQTPRPTRSKSITATQLPPLRPADPLPVQQPSDLADRKRAEIIQSMEARAQEADDPIKGMERRAQVADNPVARMEQRAKAQDDAVIGMERRMSMRELADRLEKRMDATLDPAKNLERRLDVARDPAHRLEQRMDAQRDAAINLQRRFETVEGRKQPSPTGSKPAAVTTDAKAYERAIDALGKGINIRYGYEDDPIR